MLVKHLGIDTDKPVEEMNREEILFALARECRAEHYQSILNWRTKTLAALIKFYKTSAPHEIFMGIDFARGPDDHVVVERVGHPAKKSYKKGESMWIEVVGADQWYIETPSGKYWGSGPIRLGGQEKLTVATSRKLHINPTPSRDRLIFIQHPMDAKGEMRIQRKMVVRGAPILVPKGGDVYDGETGELIVKNPIR